MNDNVTAQTITPLLPIIIPVITFIIGLLVKPIYDFWQNNYIKKKQRQDDARKKHFQILETRFISPMLELLNNQTVFYGEISNKGQGRGWSPNDKLFTINFMEGDGEIFKLHFQSKVTEIGKLTEAINEHNEEFDNFMNYLRNKIQEYTNIPFGNGKPRPFLHPQLTGYMRLTLFQSIESYVVAHDFKNTQIVCINNGEYWRLTSSTQNVAYTDLTTKKECQDCGQKLIELQYSPQLMEKVRNIDFKAKQLRKEIETIVKSLDFLCLKYKELEKLLYPEKECLYCQAIFHPDKGA
jgi:hypothetical protein